MSMSHVIVERILADSLKLNYDSFSAGGCVVAIVELKEAEKLFTAYKDMFNDFKSNRPLISNHDAPVLTRSNLDGIGIIVSNCVPYNIVDTFTDGDFKSTDNYDHIIKLESITREPRSEFVTKFMSYYNKTTTPPATPVEVPVEAPVAVNQDKEMIRKSLSSLFGTALTVKDCSNGKSVFYTHGQPKLTVDNTFELCNHFNKHIIICKGSAKNYINSVSKLESVVVVYTTVSEINDFNVSTIKNGFLCLGKYVDYICTPKIKEGAASYGDYDSAMKDVTTNITFAVRSKNEVFILVGTNTNAPEFYSSITKEIIRRWDSNLTYEELKTIDESYQKSAIDNDKSKYIDFVVNNSFTYIKNIKKALEKGISEIGALQKELLEKMKIYNQYVQIIENFDEASHEEKERVRAMESFNAVMNIPQIKSVFINENMVNIFTNDLNALDDRTGKLHNIGTFHIQLNMIKDTYDPNNSIIIKNTKYAISGYSGIMEAPHIFNGGHMCHGNLLQIVTECYANRDLYSLVSALIMFIESANTADVAGEYINRWPVVEQKVKDETDDELTKFLTIGG